MRAVTWHGPGDVRVEEVPDPVVQEPSDAVVRVTSTGLCGSDLHLYGPLAPFMGKGDVLGHEPMGIVEAVGSAVTGLSPGDRVVVPFQIACGTCWMCTHRLPSQCETTQVREHGTGARLFGYSALYGSVPGGQAQLLRVPHASYGPIPVPHGPPDERFLFLSDVLPTAWQGVEYAEVPEGGTLLVLGLGPIGQMCVRVARHRGHRVLGVDRVPERLEAAAAWGAEVLDFSAVDVVREVLDRTEGRGADSVVDAVGMEAHGSPVAEAGIKAVSRLPSRVSGPVMKRAGIDQLAALRTAIDAVRRGGTLSLSGVYGGQTDPLPMMTLFDKQVRVHMGQANVRRWVDDLLPLVTGEDDPLGVEDFATHRLPLEDAPDAYRDFRAKERGMIKVVLDPWT